MPADPRHREALSILQNYLGSPAPLELPEVWYPYDVWERALIERWGVQVLTDEGPLALIYLTQETSLDPFSMRWFEAARCFVVNKLRYPGREEQFVMVQGEIDRIPPEHAEEPLTDEDWDRIQRQDELVYNPTPRRTYFDMGRGDDPSKRNPLPNQPGWIERTD